MEELLDALCSLRKEMGNKAFKNSLKKVCINL